MNIEQQKQAERRRDIILQYLLKYNAITATALFSFLSGLHQHSKFSWKYSLYMVRNDLTVLGRKGLVKFLVYQDGKQGGGVTERRIATLTPAGSRKARAVLPPLATLLRK